MRERVLTIGDRSPLIGVASEPADFDFTKPALLILNSGVMHHVGTCRLSVRLARTVAQRGLLAVRFDFSGVGDSEARRTSEPLDEVWRKECSEVMDHLQKTRGAKEFILFGLCSGADAAYNTALSDPRVIAFSQIDGYCYVNWRYYFALLHRRRFMRFLSRRWKLLRHGSPARSRHLDGVSEQPLELPTYRRRVPPRLEVVEGLRGLVGRGVRMFHIFTGGEAHYSYEGQYRDTFHNVDFGDLLRVDYYPLSDHIITQPRHQLEIVRSLSDWVVGLAERSQSVAATMGNRAG